MKKLLLFAVVLSILFSAFPARAAIRITDRENLAPCTYKEFYSSLTEYLEGRMDVYDPLFSAGYWTRLIMVDGSTIMLVRTDSPKKDGHIQQILLYEPEEYAEAVMLFSLAAMDGVSDLTNKQAQKLTVQYNQVFVLKKQSADEVFTTDGNLIQTKDGYSLTLGREDARSPMYWASIDWQEPLDSGVAVPSAEERVSIPDGPALDAFLLEAGAHCEDWLDLNLFTLPEYEERDGLRMYSLEWDDCFLILLTDPETDRVVNYAMVSDSGAISSFWLHNYALLLAAAQVPAESEDTTALLLLGGGSTDWDYLVTLTPYVVYGGVAMYCLWDPSSQLPMIYVGGWETGT